MTETKKTYRKVKGLIKETVTANAGVTLDEMVEKTGVVKWYVKKKLDILVAKGEVKVEDGKYSVVVA